MPQMALKLLLLAWLCTGEALAAGQSLAIGDAWIREAPPGAAVLAGYLRLDNPGDKALVIEAFHSQDFERIELHRTIVEDGVARMLHVDRLAVPPGDSVSLEPGGMHLMLFNPARPLRQDDRVVFSVELAGESSLRFEAVVKRVSGDDSRQHHHHHHH
jgi:copper(I)-binding protein